MIRILKFLNELSFVAMTFTIALSILLYNMQSSSLAPAILFLLGVDVLGVLTVFGFAIAHRANLLDDYEDDSEEKHETAVKAEEANLRRFYEKREPAEKSEPQRAAETKPAADKSSPEREELRWDTDGINGDLYNKVTKQLFEPSLSGFGPHDQEQAPANEDLLYLARHRSENAAAELPDLFDQIESGHAVLVDPETHDMPSSIPPPTEEELLRIKTEAEKAEEVRHEARWETFRKECAEKLEKLRADETVKP